MFGLSKYEKIQDKLRRFGFNSINDALGEINTLRVIRDHFIREAAELKKENERYCILLEEKESEISILKSRVESLTSRLNKAITERMELEESIRQRDSFIIGIRDGTQTNMYPVAASVISDYETLYLRQYADALDWGNNIKRQQKMTSLVELRKWARGEIEKHKIASYQLQYLLALYPALQDVLDTDYCDLRVERDKIPEYDYTREYLSKEEWAQLSESERNQLALDRYIESHNKTKWQIGRDYEMYIGYTYEQNGWTVQYTGIEMGFEDLGRDLIAQKDGKIEIVQCKYWSESKTIHEKHVMQLYGTVIAYQIQNPRVPPERINAVFITNIQLSDTARKFADVLDVHVREHVPKGDYPRIKCNIGKDECGDKTYIYHLPMDLNYDSVKLDKPGECKVFTVKEAEDKGFRRAFKWHSTE